MKKAMHCYVSGRVQGVFFRMATQEQANLFGVTGWVRNLPDGRVEVMACGDDNQLRKMKDWLRRGPDMANVLDLECEDAEYIEYETFSIR